MTSQKVEHGYVFWNDVLLLPTKKRSKEGKVLYFRKEIPFEKAPNYWEYICEDGSWNIYYVKRGVNRRLAQANIGEFSPESIMARLADKDISVNDCKQIEENHGRPTERIMPGIIWAEMFDGKSVFDLMEQWPKMPYAHVKMVIANEGGYIDDEGIVHRTK